MRFLRLLIRTAIESAEDFTDAIQGDARGDDKGALWVRVRGLVAQVAGAVTAGQRAEPTLDPADGGVHVHVAGGDALPLPSGAATETTLASLRKYKGAVQLTPDDSNNLTHEAAGLFVDKDSTVKFDTYGYDGTGTTTLALTVPGGTLIPLPVKKLYATGTTLGGAAVAVY